MTRTFAVLIHQDAPFPTSSPAGGIRRQRASTPPTSPTARDYRDPDGYWLDGFTVLAAAAAGTAASGSARSWRIRSFGRRQRRP